MERFFFSRFDNRVDRKGRVSVPARWRPILSAQSFNGIVAYPSPVAAAIEGGGMERLERLAESIDTFNPFSDNHGDFAAALLTRSHPLAFDSEVHQPIRRRFPCWSSISRPKTNCAN